MPNLLRDLLQNRQKPANPRGIYSVCSAHPWVIRAALQQSQADDSSLLIEATSNQVNQQGGYTGMQPVDFRNLVLQIANDEGFPHQRIILGGDHLGPTPWQNLPSEQAMSLAEEMIAAYAQAGFTKLHLDASMPCADDNAPLSDEVIANRAARLCAVAEKTAKGDRPLYIIGTEVPVPGGATESLSELQVTQRSAAEKTLQVHHEIFAAHGLGDAWPRVAGIVVQPGVEFNHDSVVDYIPEKASDLKTLLEGKNGLVFEAHSTDYQRPESYRSLVQDGFAILKVGPQLTFAMREALFALAAIEVELIAPSEQSHLPEAIEAAMLENPKYWAGHYHGTPEQQRILRRYSYSDRLRYYWTVPTVHNAVSKLLANLQHTEIPETLLSAYLPEQYNAIRNRSLKKTALPIVCHRIQQALNPYAVACFGN